MRSEHYIIEYSNLDTTCHTHLTYYCTIISRLFLSLEDEFMIRIKEMPHMIFQTRKALTNDDWDKSYVDTYVHETSSEYIKTNVKSKDKEFENLIPENILAKEKLEKDTKEKRKKDHFFHGKIKYNT